MLNTQLHVGMNWIAKTLRALGHGGGGHSHFVVSLNGQRRVVTFDEADLENMPDDPRLQILIEGDLRAFLSDDCADPYPRRDRPP